ncbi:PilZ domain-containing protein [Sphingomonadaceae bacterium]|nr:PilZ domain-containing protein [Sphingomonadaceae bacterium]
MSGVDTRHISRDSLFLAADLRLDGAEEAVRVKVRNLSAGGMMAEGGPKVVAGTHLSIMLKNIGWVDGNVAWVQDNRFGIAFADEIDPKLPRQQVGGGDISTPRFVRSAGFQSRADADADKARLRKI